jgi:IS4 transposase
MSNTSWHSLSMLVIILEIILRESLFQHLTRFKYIITVPAGDVKVYEEFDGDYTTNSKRHRRDEQVKFRLLVYSKEK